VLRQRVDGDISAFLAAFDAALADDSIERRADHLQVALAVH
jgi:hypothetical protein